MKKQLQLKLIANKGEKSEKQGELQKYTKRTQNQRAAKEELKYTCVFILLKSENISVNSRFLTYPTTDCSKYLTCGFRKKSIYTHFYINF